MSADHLAQKSAIFDQFLRGEIDATAAAKQIRALPRSSPELEFASVGELGRHADQVMLQKVNQFWAAWRALDKGPAA